MRKEVEQRIRDSRVLAIVRGFDPDVCLHLAEAYLAGGIRAMEVTYVQTDRASWKKTAAAIRAIRKRFAGELSVGAGTVLTAEQLQMTHDAGGEFMVAPNVKPDLVRRCADLDMASIPGALSPTEAVDAWEAGASFVKIFPAGQMGPAYVKALKAPLAHIPMLAVAGVTLDNAAEFMKAGCVGIAVSGPLTNREAIAAGQWDRITAVARAYVEKTVI